MSSDNFQSVRLMLIEELEGCTNMLSINTSANTSELVITRLDSVLSALDSLPESIAERRLYVLIRDAISLLESQIETPISRRTLGRPIQHSIPATTLEHLLSMNFRVTQIAEMYGASRRTVHRILQRAGLSASSSYTSITDEQLVATVTEILLNHPNTGYKRMKGFLLMRAIKVTDQRVREVMRVADPQGVFQRTQEHRAIVRREYYVDYSNQMWHIDANLKLIRWGLVIRGGIDGKSRCVTYLDVGSDNKAISTLNAFLDGVALYGIPQRTRSDKGKENVLVARFMLESRGLGRSSHICGRSVHNQRIERFWGDLFRMSSFYYNVFKCLEEDGILDIDSSRHMQIFQMVFIPRIQRHLDQFREGWNCHPLSTEHNLTPNQLLLLHLPPPEADLPLNEVDSADLHFSCEDYEDLNLFEESDSIVDPIVSCGQFSEEEVTQLRFINPHAESSSFGCDIFYEALQCVNEGLPYRE